MLLSQYRRDDGRPQIVARDGTEAYDLRTGMDVHALALDCLRRGLGLEDGAVACGLGRAVDVDRLAAEDRLLPPLTHPDPARLRLTGPTPGPGAWSDGGGGARPGWTFRGDGTCLVAPGAARVAPGVVPGGGEAAEIAGLYMVGPNGASVRLGFALIVALDAWAGRRGYAIGPEVVLGLPPRDVEGMCRLRRGAETVWESGFVSRAAQRAEAIAEIERAQVDHNPFWRPGDVRVHAFGTAAPSSGPDARARDGDVLEVDCAPFGLPLRLALSAAPGADLGRARAG